MSAVINLTREDLLIARQGTPFDLLNVWDFKLGLKQVRNASFICFTDEDGKQKILKNRNSK